VEEDLDDGKTQRKSKKENEMNTSVLYAILLWTVYLEHHGGKARQVVNVRTLYGCM
jgi:hypothetical protein